MSSIQEDQVRVTGDDLQAVISAMKLWYPPAVHQHEEINDARHDCHTLR